MATATKAELEAALEPYFREMKGCYDYLLGWALLHLVVCMPDICAALTHGDTTGSRYRQWCVDYLPSSVVNEHERYQIRCKLLHEGSTVPEGHAVRASNFWFMPAAGSSKSKTSGSAVMARATSNSLWWP